MLTKLTLSIDDKVTEKAKMYARKHNVSLSRMVENYLNSLSNEGEYQQQDLCISQGVHELRGMYKTSRKVDADRVKTKRLKKKYDV